MKKIIPSDAVLVPDSASCVFNGVIFDVYQWQQPLHNTNKSTFEMLRRADTVEIIGVIDGQIIVIEDNQPHSGTMIGFPGGRVDKEDKSILGAAEREVLEETGYRFNKWKLIAVKQPFTKIEWFIYYWLALEGERVASQSQDAGEDIAVSLLNFADVKKMSIEGVGYLRESRDLFEKCSSMSELLALPEFKGQEVDR